MLSEEHLVFETVELRVIRAVEHALVVAKLTHRLDVPRPSLHEVGPRKPKLRVFVGEADFAAARDVVERALIRFGRVRALQPKREPMPEIASNTAMLPIMWKAV